MQSLSTEFLAAAMAAPEERLTEALSVLKGAPRPKAVERVLVREKFMSLAQVARETGINRMTLWRYRVPGHNHHSCVRYRVSEVLAYLETPEFQRTIKALKANGWKRPSAADVARITLDESNSQAEKNSSMAGDTQHKQCLAS